MKKYISLILIYSLICSLFPPITYASPIGGSKGIFDDLRMQGSIITWETEGKKATSGIYYRTIGWNVHRTEVSDGNISRSKVPYVSLKVTNMFSIPTTPGNVRTTFEIDKKTVETAVSGLGTILGQGETVFVSAITEVRRGTYEDYTVLGTYQDLESLKKSQAWARPDDFDQYYNRRLVLDFAPTPIKEVYKVNGKTIDELTIDRGTKKAKDSHTTTFPQTITVDGKEATFVGSYAEAYSQRNKQLNKQSVLTRTDIIPPDSGIDIVGQYTMPLEITVEHMNKDTGDILGTEIIKVSPKEERKINANTYAGLGYLYSEMSLNGGQTWYSRSTNKTRNIITTSDVILRFYYSKDSSIIADLTLTPNPSAIKKGQTEKVTFTLDARNSTSKYPIKEYKFWLSDRESDLNKTANKVVTANKIEIIETDVEPNTTWYGKVEITDTRGEKSIATASAHIGETQAAANVTAKIDVEYKAPTNGRPPATISNKLVDYISYTEIVENDKRFPTSFENPVMVIWMNIPPEGYFDNNGLARYGMDYDVNISARRSTATNGVGKSILTHFNIWSPATKEVTGASDANFSGSIAADDVDWIWKQLQSDKYDWVGEKFTVEVNDSIQTDKTDTATLDAYFVGIPPKPLEKQPPSVSLSINQKEFARGEEIKFRPGFVEDLKTTYLIQSKRWEILTESNDIVVLGDNEIPSSVTADYVEGTYKARQYISYRDNLDTDHEIYAEVTFKVTPIRPPNVTIASDKDKYILDEKPVQAIITTTFDEKIFVTHLIDKKEYKLVRNQDKKIIMNDEGTFPNILELTMDFAPGMYTAYQTIFWWEYGEYKSKTVSCQFKLISPVPAADFRVDMKMTNVPTWNRIDLPGESGKQFKQIRIDLSPSIELNKELENPYPIDFTNEKTRIQIIPLTLDGKVDFTKNSTIHTPNTVDKQIADNIVTFKGKKFIDVRFDSYGKYKIRTQVYNGHYVSGLIEREIEVREDLAPSVDINFDKVITEGGNNKVYRTTSDLKVRFGVNTNAVARDDDAIDYSSGKLEIRYDYNADNDTSNDGVHSMMYVTKDYNYIQSYIESIIKNNMMNRFDMTMFSNDFPMLGKLRLEYSIGEIPLIPNFTAATMPSIPQIRGTSELLPINKKVLYMVNNTPNIKVEMGKETQMEIYIFMEQDTLHFDLDTLKSYYGRNATIYLIDKKGNKVIIQ